MHNDRLGSESTPLSLTLLCKKECYWACLACKGKQKSMAHNEGCGDHRRKYRKRKIGNGRQRKATNWCGKKGLLRKIASHRLPLTEGNGKKREADVSRKATDDGGQKNNGKFTNGKSGKKNLRKKFYGKQSQRPPLNGTLPMTRHGLQRKALGEPDVAQTARGGRWDCFS